MTTAKERPILFSGEMVRAILAGRKTQTRRPIPTNKVPADTLEAFFWWHDYLPKDVCAADGLYVRTPRGLAWRGPCPFGVPGDRLWVKECFKIILGDDPRIEYRAGGCESFEWKSDRCTELADHFNVPNSIAEVKHAEAIMAGAVHPVSEIWRPSIHMPRVVSRITLEVVAVRAERVQEIGDNDLQREGFGADSCGLRERQFESAWDSIYAKGGLGWAANPWVWAVEFRVAKETTCESL